MSLEKQLTELEALTEEMQSSDITIDASIKTYEKIVKLSEKTLTLLNKNQEKVETLTEKATQLINEH